MTLGCFEPWIVRLYHYWPVICYRFSEYEYLNSDLSLWFLAPEDYEAVYESGILCRGSISPIKTV